eukprot:scaffold74451_cov17-Tisochrysis_lutea.AAC.1
MPVYVPPLRVLATQHWSIQQVLEGKPGSQQTSLCALTQAPGRMLSCHTSPSGTSPLTTKDGVKACTKYGQFHFDACELLML